jgi:hypothetical protein
MTMSNKAKNQGTEKSLVEDDLRVIEELDKRASKLITDLQMLGELHSHDKSEIKKIRKTLASQSRSYSDDLDLQFAFENALNHAINLAELFSLVATAGKRRLLKRMKLALVRKARDRIPGASAKQFSQEVQERLMFLLYVTYLFLQDAFDRYAALHRVDVDGEPRLSDDQHFLPEDIPAAIAHR